MGKKNVGVTVNITPELEELLNRPMPDFGPVPVKEERYDPETDPEFVADYLKLQFVAELRHAMEKVGVNGSELARRMGTTRQAVSRALDKEDPDNFTIKKMAEYVTSIGARISLKVHEPGTMIMAVPVHDTSPAAATFDCTTAVDMQIAKEE